MLADIHNGFGGLASAALEGLADEYGARKIVVFACYPTTLDDGQVTLPHTAQSASLQLSTAHVMSHPLTLNKQSGHCPAGAPSGGPEQCMGSGADCS